MNPDIEELGRALDTVGFVHLSGWVGDADFRRLARSLGRVVGEELIALRPGAHAYVAKASAVPLHTDHPKVRIVGWRCEEQDANDGASLLLDGLAVLRSLAPMVRATLPHVELACPPLSGGPPSLRSPVLTHAGGRERLFCSPWLRPADPLAPLEEALSSLRCALAAAASSAVRIRLAAGEVLFIDNQRILHGRDAIPPTSTRRLVRLWVA